LVLISAEQQHKTPPGTTHHSNRGKKDYNYDYFARAHQNWTVEDWKNVAWSDESRFLLRHSDGRVRIWRKQN